MSGRNRTEIINTLAVAIPKSYRWPMGDEGKQAIKLGGVSGPPSYPWGSAHLSRRKDRPPHGRRDSVSRPRGLPRAQRGPALYCNQVQTLISISSRSVPGYNTRLDLAALSIALGRPSRPRSLTFLNLLIVRSSLGRFRWP